MQKDRDEVSEAFMERQRFVVKLKRARIPSSRACVISCATTSWDRQVKTRPCGRLRPPAVSASKKPKLSSPGRGS
jgi:hypothetical protein